MADVLMKHHEKLLVADLVSAFTYATDWLGVYVPEVNALNVYPVPDGDTGTNMHLTMQSVRRQLREENPKTMREFAHALSYGSLLGARGNSGVILSQILKGFAETIKSHKQLGPSELTAALKSATKSAYAAVMKPVEGTILTVVKRSADGAEASKAKDPLGLLHDAWKAGQEALAETQEMLPMLKQAGVVDSGGLGFLRVLEGIIASYEGKELPEPPVVERRAQEQFEEEEFGFCTEFLLSDATTSVKDMQEMVQSYGDSLLVVGAEGYIKGHIHTEEPEKLLALVAQHGKMVRSKIEDMSEQHSEILAGVDMKEASAPTSALVAVSDGYGVTKVFRSLNARVVGGGQTNNPSVQDIADAVRSVGAQQVIVMPNNKNIIMAANRVAELVPEKTVKVLETKTMGAGLAAAVMFNESMDAETQLPELQDAANHAVTLEVTTASRTTMIDDLDIAEGDYIGLIDNKLVSTEPSPQACLVALLEQVADDYEIATLFYNSIVADTIDETVKNLSNKFEDLEIELHAGAPELYAFVMMLE